MARSVTTTCSASASARPASHDGRARGTVSEDQGLPAFPTSLMTVGDSAADPDGQWGDRDCPDAEGRTAHAGGTIMGGCSIWLMATAATRAGQPSILIQGEERSARRARAATSRRARCLAYEHRPDSARLPRRGPSLRSFSCAMSSSRRGHVRSRCAATRPTPSRARRLGLASRLPPTRGLRSPRHSTTAKFKIGG
jgi:hypothetical protein